MIDLKKITKLVEQQRDLIAVKIKRLKREDPFSTEDRSIIVEPGTDAAVLFGHEKTVILEDRLKKDLKEIETALKKIKKGTYGICENCRKPIGEKRLEAKPQAVYCVTCEGELERGKKQS